MEQSAMDDAAVVEIGAEIEVVVGAMAAGGGCVARAADERVVFVRHAIPGERVRARVLQETAHYLRADAIEILEPAPGRVHAPCPHAGPGRCGGCDWQHIDPALQRQLKSHLVGEQLRRLAGVDLEPVVEEVGGSLDGLGWRTRVRFAVDERGRTGFRRHRSHDLELVEECPIATPAVTAIGAGHHKWGGADEVEVVALGDPRPRGASAVVSVTERRRNQRRNDRSKNAQSVGHVAALPGAGLVMNGHVIQEPGHARIVVRGRGFRVSAGSFWQVHQGAPDLLVGAVLDGLDAQPGESAVDLFAGVGLFSTFLAERLGPRGSVLAVERDPHACADARVNAADLPQLRVLAGQVTPDLVAREIGNPDLLVLDPAREGMGIKTMSALGDLEPPPRRVAYVSCDPASFARDLRVLLDRGWRLETLRAFDLFPMTEHVELVGILVPPTQAAVC